MNKRLERRADELAKKEEKKMWGRISKCND
jgi:hypothetical protein